MNEIDPFVKALISLCEKEGGYKYVADKAKVSADNLWQIISGTKLPSGNPRGVGPGLRSKLTNAYPEWITGHATANITAPMPTVQAPAGPTVAHLDQRAGQRRRTADIDVVDCFIDLLARADAPVLEAMAGLLPALARNPSNQQIVRSVRALFEPEAFAAKSQRQR